MAEREGFEPSIHFWAYAPLAGECLRPLGHLSGQARDCTFSRSFRPNSPFGIIGYERADAWVDRRAARSLPSSRSWRLLELERPMQYAHRQLQVFFVDHNRCLDLRGRNHLDVDALVGQALNILAAMPTCDRIPIPTSETLQMRLSPIISRATNPFFFSCSSTSSAF